MRVLAFVTTVALAGLAAGAAQAADAANMEQASPYDPGLFDFYSFYVGAQGGAVVGGDGAGQVGVVAGANFAVTDPVFVGVEFQGDAILRGGGTTYDFYTLGRAGVAVSGDLLAYAAAGPGWDGGTGGYAFGGGAEYALTSQTSLKGEAFGTGAWGGGPSHAKLQAGLLFHLQ